MTPTGHIRLSLTNPVTFIGTQPDQSSDPYAPYENKVVVDTFSYRDFAVIRTFDGKANAATVEIHRGNKRLRKIVLAEALLHRDTIKVEFRSLLAKLTKQLVLVEYSGGAHCCYQYQIFDLYPRFREIFNSEAFPVFDYMTDLEFKDLDGDGVFELVDDINTFASYQSVFSGSVMPEMVFKFDRRTAKYRPANEQFKSYVLRGVAEEIRDLQQENNKRQNKDPGFDGTSYEHKALDVLLKYVYAGEERRGWRFFEQNYQTGFYDTRDIKSMLAQDGAYRYIYRHSLR